MALPFLLPGCEKKTKVTAAPLVVSFTPSVMSDGPITEDEFVGVYFMPSWDTSPDPAMDRDSFLILSSGYEKLCD